MTLDEMRLLGIGDIIRHHDSGRAYIVTEKPKETTAVVIRTLIATNPIEWDIVSKHSIPSEKKGSI